MLIDLSDQYMKLEEVAARLGYPNAFTARNCVLRAKLFNLYRFGERGIFAKRKDVEGYVAKHGRVNYVRRLRAA